MYFWVARVIRNAPRRCTFMTVSQSFSDILKIRLSLVTPALLISTVGSPSSATTLSTAAGTCSALLTSAPTAIALPPAFSISATVLGAVGLVEVEHRDGQPVSGEALGGAGPDPRAAPVTIAIRCGITLRFLSLCPTPLSANAGVPASLFRTRPPRQPPVGGELPRGLRWRSAGGAPAGTLSVFGSGSG